MTSVEVSVETLQESQIQEVTLDGNEIYSQPLSMSENLTKLAHKIDFSKDESESKRRKTSEKEDEAEEEKAVTPLQPSLWPWHSVRTKLRAALTEVNVCLDVLKIAKEKKYLTLDPVTQSAPDPRSGVHLMAKKRALASAASILSSGAERLKKSQDQIAKKSTPDFHLEMCKLRQNWRLKKAGNTILGDLSYKSAGSRYWQNGTFEVKKSDQDSEESDSRSALQVTVPSELEGIAYIQVAIKHVAPSIDLPMEQEEDTEFGGTELRIPSVVTGNVTSDTHWQRKLENAQNVIFCKEVFSQLAREATQLQSQIPHLVVGNNIFSHLFPGVQLSISLVHYSSKDQHMKPPMPPKPDHNHVLEHSLHQLMREVHFKNIYHPMPHPVTALLGMSKKRRLAGPHAFSRDQLLELSTNETLLEQIIMQARHIVIRKRTIDVIDETANLVQDPQLCVHWSNISSAHEALIKITITTNGYESIRTPFSVHLTADQIKIITKEGKHLQLSHDPQELKDFLLTQMCSYHMTSIGYLVKWMGWQQLSVSPHIGIGDVEYGTNAQTTMIASPRGDRVLMVRLAPLSPVRVHLQKIPGNLEDMNRCDFIDAEKWTHLGGKYTEIHLNKIEGRTFCSKMESLMCCVSGY